MNPDLHGAWLTAGDRLQPYGDWASRNWMWLVPALAAAIFAVWAIRRAVRKVDQILADELPATADARKEDR